MFDRFQGVFVTPVEGSAARMVVVSWAVEAAGGTAPGEPFSALLARVVRANPGADVACIEQRTLLPVAWQVRLQRVLGADGRIAAVVPLCDDSPLHALVDAELRAGVRGREDAVDRSAFAMGTRGYYETPSLHAACVALRSEALQAALTWLEEEARDVAETLAGLQRQWRDAGRVLVLCDHLYVTARARLPELSCDPVERNAFAHHAPLGALRRGLREAIEQGLPPVAAPGLDERPVQLHVMHFWGGGVDKWVRDFSRADTARVNLLLATYRIGEQGGQRVVLYADPDARVPLHTWDIAQPLRATAVASLEYARILRQVVKEHCVESVVVSSLIGHTLDVLRLEVPTVIVAHDFYPICQAINPRCDAVCPSCSAADLAACARRNPHYETLGSPTPESWERLRSAYLEMVRQRCIQVVVPSASVRETLVRLAPALADHPIRVIPHGIELAKSPAPAVETGPRMRLVVLGRLAENKGSELLREAAAGLAPLADVTLVGCGPQAMALASASGWDAIEAYEPEELPAIIAAIRPHAAILASVVPETFSYTLSELWALGVPPLATALGAFRERIRDGVDGMLFEPTAAGLVARVESLARDPARLQAIAAEIAGMPPPRTTAEMVRDYETLLPSGTRPPARYPVGEGLETALTEPYRQLTQAYVRLTDSYQRVSEAYAQRSAAYEHARAEFERVHAELEKLRALHEQYGDQLESLNVGRRWWRAPEAERLILEMRSKSRAGDAAPAQPTNPEPTRHE